MKQTFFKYRKWMVVYGGHVTHKVMNYTKLWSHIRGDCCSGSEWRRIGHVS